MTRIWIISKHWHQNTHTIFREQANRRQPSPLINHSNSFFPSHIYSSSHAETGYLRPVYIYAYTCPRHLKWKYFSFLFQPKQIILLLSLSPPLSLSLSLTCARNEFTRGCSSLTRRIVSLPPASPLRSTDAWKRFTYFSRFTILTDVNHLLVKEARHKSPPLIIYLSITARARACLSLSCSFSRGLQSLPSVSIYPPFINARGDFSRKKFGNSRVRERRATLLFSLLYVSSLGWGGERTRGRESFISGQLVTPLGIGHKFRPVMWRVAGSLYTCPNRMLSLLLARTRERERERERERTGCSWARKISPAKYR